jgi:hypothetical protein
MEVPQLYIYITNCTWVNFFVVRNFSDCVSTPLDIRYGKHSVNHSLPNSSKEENKGTCLEGNERESNHDLEF